MNKLFILPVVALLCCVGTGYAKEKECPCVAVYKDSAGERVELLEKVIADSKVLKEHHANFYQIIERSEKAAASAMREFSKIFNTFMKRQGARLERVFKEGQDAYKKLKKTGDSYLKNTARLRIIDLWEARKMKKALQK